MSMISDVSMYRQTFLVLIVLLWISEPTRTHHLGRAESRSGVKPLRQPKIPTAPKISQPDFLSTFEANSHYQTMLTRTKCREPRPVVVNVKQEYHSTAVNYLPHCTILHRCDAEAGCCGKGRSCTWDKREYVNLYFYAIPEDTGHVGDEIVKLSFTNHTSCACKEDPEFNEVESHNTTEQPFNTINNDDDYDDKPYKPCPPPFAKRFLTETQESCDCFDGEDACINIKKGHRELDRAVTNAVRRGEYDTPQCYTGTFNTRTGFCPRVCEEGKVYNQRRKQCVDRHRRLARNKQRHARHRTT